jgi:hypothetical protein
MTPATPAGRGPGARSVTGAGDAAASPQSGMAEGRFLRPKASLVGRVPGASAPREASIQPPARPPLPSWRLNADAIERARVLKGWTYTNLARVANVDAKTLRDAIHHRRQPTFGTVHTLCTALGLTLEEVIVFGTADATSSRHPPAATC